MDTLLDASMDASMDISNMNIGDIIKCIIIGIRDHPENLYCGDFTWTIIDERYLDKIFIIFKLRPDTNEHSDIQLAINLETKRIVWLLVDSWYFYNVVIIDGQDTSLFGKITGLLGIYESMAHRLRSTQLTYSDAKKLINTITW